MITDLVVHHHHSASTSASSSFATRKNIKKPFFKLFHIFLFLYKVHYCNFSVNLWFAHLFTAWSIMINIGVVCLSIDLRKKKSIHSKSIAFFLFYYWFRFFLQFYWNCLFVTRFIRNCQLIKFQSQKYSQLHYNIYGSSLMEELRTAAYFLFFQSSQLYFHWYRKLIIIIIPSNIIITDCIKNKQHQYNWDWLD